MQLLAFRKSPKCRTKPAVLPPVKFIFIISLILGLASQTFSGSLTATETSDQIVIANGDSPVLTYQKAIVPPPPQVDPIFARSGFIHPVHAPSGGIVTGIHPADHYHHLGLWHAWVHGEHEDRPVDFWNLHDKTGRVQFAKTLKLDNTDTSAGFTVEQEAVRYRDGKGGDPIILLREQLQIIVRLVDGAYEIDYNITQKNITDQPLVLPVYRYGGGIAYRAPLDWNKDNSDYLTSEGKTRKDSHTTRARWVAMHGPTDKGAATVTIFCHPQNRDAPQHIRTWDNGKMFLNYVPIQETAWEIKPSDTITQRYRVVIADGESTTASLEPRWQRYSKD